MEPRLSFNYDGIPFPELNCTVRQEGDDTVYTLPDGLELTCHVQREDDYGIVRWVNSWHNPTDLTAVASPISMTATLRFRLTPTRRAPVATGRAPGSRICFAFG